MSRYYSLIIFTLLLTSCSVKSASKLTSAPLSTQTPNLHYNQCDLYQIYALDAQYRGDYEDAASYFEKCYKIDKKPLYIREAIRNRILLKDYKEIKRLLDIALRAYPNDTVLQRYEAAYYLDMHQYKKAQKILKNLIKLENDPSDKALLASTQLGLGETKKALRYYQKAYKKEQNAKTLIPLVNLLYYDLGKKSKAKQLLNSHVDFIGCDVAVCYKLLEIYQKEQNVKGLLSTAKKLYAKTGKKSFAKMILKIYSYDKDTQGIIAFLEKSHFDDTALLEWYVREKQFHKAATLAKKLYHDTQDLHFLAQMAMIEYESHEDGKDPKVLKRVETKFEKVIQTLNDPSYNNFYGYILIDHEIDIPKGIALVQKALDKAPNAPYYIDSLAWGYFKQGECQKAYDTIYPIMMLVNEPEITEHYKKIKACKEGKQ